MSKWDMVKLGDVCDVRDGTHDSPKYVDHGYPLVTSKNVSNGYIDITDVNYISEDDYNKIIVRSGVDNGDIIMPMIGTIGNPVVVNKPFDFAIKNVALIKFIGNNILNKYIFYILSSSIFKRYIERENRGGTQKFISLGNIRNFLIPLPPLETQKQIAKNLDTAAELIVMRKQQFAGLDNFIKSTFYDMFGDPFENPKGWNKCLLSDLAIINMGQSPNGNSYNEDGEGVPLLNGPTEFGKKYPIEKQWTTEPTKMCMAEDILFCVRGATAGKMNIANKEYCIGRGLAAIKPKQSNMQSFIYLYLEMMYTHFQSTSNGSTFINISKDQLCNLPFLKVDAKIQEQFSKIALNIDEQKALVQKAINETQYLFDSLMSQYFE